ncbi:MAG: hypothetical protein NTW21_41960 [Verrucomicrobia bacterium]|nr:hypothetical protein [Verrucomicrobiota bacterium]
MKKTCARALAVCGLLDWATGGLAAEPPADAVGSPDASQQHPFYPGIRPPPQPSPFIKLPIGAITPQGWLRRQMELDASGMCGNLSPAAYSNGELTHSGGRPPQENPESNEDPDDNL